MAAARAAGNACGANGHREGSLAALCAATTILSARDVDHNRAWGLHRRSLLQHLGFEDMLPVPEPEPETPLAEASAGDIDAAAAHLSAPRLAPAWPAPLSSQGLGCDHPIEHSEPASAHGIMTFSDVTDGNSPGGCSAYPAGGWLLDTYQCTHAARSIYILSTSLRVFCSRH